MNDWPHQIRMVEQTLAAIRDGYKRILLYAPTGAGKSLVAERLIRYALELRGGATLLTNRRLLIDQIVDAMIEARIPHGVRAAGHEENLDALLQISSVQTEYKRVIKQQRWVLHSSMIVIFDEAHLQNNEMGNALMKRWTDAGAVVIGTTATPLDLEDQYDKLIVGATLKECREVGAIVPAKHFGPDEPDIREFKQMQEKRRQEAEWKDWADLSLNNTEAAKAVMHPQIFGRVWEWYERLNPLRRPSLLFAPGVKESLWFTEQFCQKGVPWAHIDGEDVWVDGEFHRTSPELRQEILQRHRTGQIKGISNRFVLREGIDCPWIRHVIAATIFGSLQTYIQSLGRGGRADRYPDTLERYGPKDSFTIQDHGGNWHKFGSINADRTWDIESTSNMVVGIRADRLRRKLDVEPRRCPDCALIQTGRVCTCGHQFAAKLSRPVISTTGQLKELHGEIFVPRRINRAANAIDTWRDIYYRSKKMKNNPRSFAAAIAFYAMDNNWLWPDRSWPLMPLFERDLYRKVKDVPPDRLIQGREEYARRQPQAQ